MKKEKLNAKLVKVAKDNLIAKNRVAYKAISDVINGTTNSGCVYKNTIRPVYIQGSGKWTSIADHSSCVCFLLEKLKIKYIAGNDAPMGGRCGYFITIISKFED